MFWVVVILIILLASLAIMMTLALRPKAPAEVMSPRWVAEFSVDRYLPINRLLSAHDYEFLAEQPGFRPEIARDLRKQRRRVYLGYLTEMAADFERLYAAAIQAAALSPDDSQTLIAELSRQRFAFQWAYWQTRARLALNTIGIATVDAGPAIRAIQGIAESARRLNGARLEFLQ